MQVIVGCCYRYIGSWQWQNWNLVCHTVELLVFRRHHEMLLLTLLQLLIRILLLLPPNMKTINNDNNYYLILHDTWSVLPSVNFVYAVWGYDHFYTLLIIPIDKKKKNSNAWNGDLSFSRQRCRNLETHFRIVFTIVVNDWPIKKNPGTEDQSLYRW
jgi:hypothetical protein